MVRHPNLVGLICSFLWQLLDRVNSIHECQFVLFLLLSKLLDSFALLLVDHADAGLELLITLLLSIHDVLDRLLYLYSGVLVLQSKTLLHLVRFLDILADLISGCFVNDRSGTVHVVNGW